MPTQQERDNAKRDADYGIQAPHEPLAPVESVDASSLRTLVYADDLEIAGFDIRRQEPIGVPIEALNRGSDDNNIPAAALGKLEHVAVEAWPTLFAFQFLYELEPTR